MCCCPLQPNTARAVGRELNLVLLLVTCSNTHTAPLDLITGVAVAKSNTQKSDHSGSSLFGFI